jgi:hypothetical protein
MAGRSRSLRCFANLAPTAADAARNPVKHGYRLCVPRMSSGLAASMYVLTDDAPDWVALMAA